MPTSLEVVESQERVVSLSDQAGAALAQLGRRLASNTDWWGAPDDSTDERSVIDVSVAASGLWRVRVRDAVGVIVLGDVQIHVVPKIAPNHFLFLAQRSGRLPRTATDVGLGATGQLWKVVLLWFLNAGEQLLRRGLIRDYSGVHDTLSVVRGQVDVVSAARRYYTGTLRFDCMFEDHVEDNPPNRIVRAAAVHAAAAPLPESVRRRARRLVARFDNVGALRPLDWRWVPDRRSTHYIAPVTLARHVLRSIGRDMTVGGEVVWTFLIRTPELIEDGIRSVLQEAIGNSIVTKQGLQLPESPLTFNPDLRFHSNRAVGDIKYKVNSGDWNRADLYQVLAFAAALRCNDAAVLNFTVAGEVADLALHVGDYRVRQFSWPTGAPDPAKAAEAFAQTVSAWIGN